MAFLSAALRRLFRASRPKPPDHAGCPFWHGDLCVATEAERDAVGAAVAEVMAYGGPGYAVLHEARESGVIRVGRE